MDLVTGGAGFIGSHLVRALIRAGRQVRVVDDLSTGSIDRLHDVPGVDLVRADLAVDDLAPVVGGIERVFHLAAVPSVPRSVRDPLTSHAAGATATLRLLVACRAAGVARIVVSSSSSVYGDSEVTPKHEGLPVRPLSPYAVSKAASEQYASVFGRLFGLRTVSLRYFNVFGPDQDPNSQYAAVIPLFITRALRGEAVTIYGDGRQTRDFTYVANVVDANLRAAEAEVEPGTVLNIAAGRPKSVLELVEALSGIVGRRIDANHLAPRPGDILHSHADVTAAASAIGWRPQVAFEEGLARTVDWFRARAS